MGYILSEFYDTTRCSSDLRRFVDHISEAMFISLFKSVFGISVEKSYQCNTTIVDGHSPNNKACSEHYQMRQR